MKRFKKAVALTGIVLGIVLLWLVPQIGKSHYTRFTRTYEDTDKREAVAPAADTLTIYVPVEETETAPPPVIKWKRQSIPGDATLADIDAEMYSRALQFEEMEEIPLDIVVEKDSAQAPTLVSIDSIHLAATDTVAMLR
jgi:hypothetical protein